MITEPFIQPRFVGPRFEGHTLPLSAARDLAAYEELVIELAKHLFRAKHQDRERIPKGFAGDFSLHLEKLEAGSTRPALVAVQLAAGLVMGLPPEISEAKNLINQVIATEVGEPFPPAFPKEFYSYFNRIGRSLEAGERIEWTPDSATNRTVLTSEKRKRLVLAHRESFQAEINIVGSVKALDAEKRSGQLRLSENEAIPFVFDDPFFGDLKKALGNPVLHVRIRGVGVFDVNERLTSVMELDQLETLPHYPLTLRIEGLASLKSGWLEGGGVVPNSDNLSQLVNDVSRLFPDSLEYPSVVPSEEGNVIFEWIRPKARLELESNFEEQSIELYSTNLQTGSFVERKFGQDEWGKAFERVKELLSA